LIIHARSSIKAESDSFVGIVDLEITQMRIEAKEKSEATNILIKNLKASVDAKYDAYSRDLLSKLQNKLDQALDEANKEIAELTKKTLIDENMNKLVVESAKNMIFKLVNIDVPTNELKNFIKS
jgi:ABC-type antimicrobial peptide transport system permease subunit